MSDLPHWLTPLPDAEQQRTADAWAIGHRGLPGLDLMERAGAGLAELIEVRGVGGPVAVVCGGGNNGGDGLVVARLLRERGHQVDVLFVGRELELQGDALVNLQRLPGPPPRPFSTGALEGVAVIVDAILGTGASGAPRGHVARVIDDLNLTLGSVQPRPLVVACDIPSGVDASTGEADGKVLAADATVTFHAGKPGLWIAPGKELAGEVTIIDIGIPAGAPVQPRIGLIDPQIVGEIPRRDRAATKFVAGAVVVCGGSTGLTGAPCLACEAAQRAGAGYVTALVPASLNIVFEQRLLEAMSVPLPDDHGALASSALDDVLARAEHANALVLGPGLGRDPGTQLLARRVARGVEIPLLLDADGLNAHAGRLDSLTGRAAATVLTPHAGELARLLERDVAAIEAHRLAAVREAAERSGAVVVLKGDDTLVADPAGRVGVSRGDAPALATAGSGDVLSGVIGAYLAKGMGPFAAACAGVYVHTYAGRLAAEQLATEGVIARDVVELLPYARASALH